MWMMDGEDPRLEYMRGMPILVAIDESTDWMGAWVVPEKGDNWYAIKVLAGYIEETGHRRVILKSDQKRAIIKLKNAVKRESGVEIACEESPVGEPKSLGSINVQIQILQVQVRTLRDATEVRYKKRMEGDSPMIPWMVLHATGIINRFRVRSDGKTAYQRVKGRKFTQAMAEVGECILFST